MLKSTFAKYMIAFITVLLISFIVLSSIVTGVVREHVQKDQENKLFKTSTAIANHIENLTFNDLNSAILTGIVPKSIYPLINSYDDIHVIVTDNTNKILLTTVNASITDYGRIPLTISQGELGNLDFGKFELIDEEENKHFCFEGKDEGIYNERIQLCARPIVSDGSEIGCVTVFISTEREEFVVQSAKEAVTNNALWIMLAAVIAVYFITERIINPLKNMTVVVKKYAEGDFTSRVNVNGNDEVSQLGEAFNNMADTLERFQRTRNSFLASIAHDLRTPMTTISGFIDGITSGAIPQDKHDYYLGIISAEVHRLSRLVSDLLDLSRLESGDKKFVMSDFDVAEVARIVLISFEQKIEQKRLDVIFETDRDYMYVHADKDAIHQVIYNLCHNAIKFSKEGGKLAISITEDETKKIRISIYDEGLGINRDELPFVFDRFYKIDKSRGLDKTGVGLGLYICKTIIDAHGEKIYALSPNEDGAEFWFTLPSGEDDSKKRNS